METPVQIDFQGLESSATVRQRIAKHLADLETRFGRITAGRVVVKGPSPHHQVGSLYEINIRLTMPNIKDVDVSRTAQNDERYADLSFALNDAFKRARRQLQDRARRLQGQTKLHEGTPIGTVLRLDPSGDFGFLQTADARELYFHKNSVINDAFSRLASGTRVFFAEEQGEKGPQASTVRLVGKHSFAEWSLVQECLRPEELRGRPRR